MRRLLPTSAWLVLSLLLLPLLLLPACGAGSSSADAVALVRQAHARADAALDEGDPAAALVALQPVLAPAALASLPRAERRALLQDAHFRVAELHRRAGRPAQAVDHAQAGLALGDARDLLAANLYMTLGRSFEALGRDREAASALHDALQINEILLQAALAGEPAEEAP